MKKLERQVYVFKNLHFRNKNHMQKENDFHLQPTQNADRNNGKNIDNENLNV